MQRHYIFFSVLFQTKYSLVWKRYTLKCVGFSKTIPVWFGTKKIDFANHIFQTQFRLLWDNSVFLAQNDRQTGRSQEERWAGHHFQRQGHGEELITPGAVLGVYLQ